MKILEYNKNSNTPYIFFCENCNIFFTQEVYSINLSIKCPSCDEVKDFNSIWKDYINERRESTI